MIALLQAVIEKSNLNPSEVGDIVVGTVLAPGSQRASECRMAAFYAGFPGIYSILHFMILQYVMVLTHTRRMSVMCRNCAN